MPRCPSDQCATVINEKGEKVAAFVPLRFAPYRQPGTERGLLFAWFCVECGYDSSRERFPSKPNLWLNASATADSRPLAASTPNVSIESVPLSEGGELLAEQIKSIERRIAADKSELERTKQRFKDELAKRELGIE